MSVGAKQRPFCLAMVAFKTHLYESKIALSATAWLRKTLQNCVHHCYFGHGPDRRYGVLVSGTDEVPFGRGFQSIFTGIGLPDTRVSHWTVRI